MVNGASTVVESQISEFFDPYKVNPTVKIYFPPHKQTSKRMPVQVIPRPCERKDLGSFNVCRNSDIDLLLSV